MAFFNCETLFHSSGERSLPYLSSVYNDSKTLSRSISRIMGEVLTEAELRGKTVLLKPNWVLHNRRTHDDICLRTHDNIVLSALENVLQMRPGRVVIGDAPVQGCDWSRVVTPLFHSSIQELGNRYSVPVEISDFRRVTFNTSRNILETDRKDLSAYALFDLGFESALEPITAAGGRFRVVDYDPRRLSESHSAGTHKYCIAKQFFDADIVISLPKVKTHQKTGITAALKNLVGINGDKDFLPHHRVGGVNDGGDCYPGSSTLRRLAEWSLDRANERRGRHTYWPYRAAASLSWRISKPSPVHNLGAAWHGNDTCWRMVADLNTIATFGNVEGKVCATPQRTLFSLCDGIVGGQGDGPLNPEPLPLGILAFTNNSALADICFGTLMGFNVEKIPLLRHALQMISDETVAMRVNGEKSVIGDLEKYAIQTLPPPGWVDYLGANSENAK